MKKRITQLTAYGVLEAQEKALIENLQRLEKEVSQTKLALEFTRDAKKALEGSDKPKSRG